eukprot:TRINITY_DN26119_c0_g1_i1.p1 TRINITY_DN26119_c0_g1~~TRINITY_DN26119_c0_g1_i1.p1  ORF type:complete len:500 (+),score=86.78 TRINITY_DN26119_c0_g1_i1:142-1641(+)
MARTKTEDEFIDLIRRLRAKDPELVEIQCSKGFHAAEEFSSPAQPYKRPHLGVAETMLLFEALEKNPYVTELSLASCAVEDVGVPLLLQVMSSCPAMATLTLSGRSGRAAGLSLSCALQLVRFCRARPEFEVRGVDPLAWEKASRFDEICERLLSADSTLTAVSVAELVWKVGSHPNRDPGEGDPSQPSEQGGVGSSSTLSGFGAGGSVIRDEPIGVSESGKAVLMFDDEAAVFLAAAVEGSPHISSLDVQGCRIGDAGMTALCNALLSCPQLRLLELEDHFISPAGATQIAHFAHKMPTVEIAGLSSAARTTGRRLLTMCRRLKDRDPSLTVMPSCLWFCDVGKESVRGNPYVTVMTSTDDWFAPTTLGVKSNLDHAKLAALFDVELLYSLPNLVKVLPSAYAPLPTCVDIYRCLAHHSKVRVLHAILLMAALCRDGRAEVKNSDSDYNEGGMLLLLATAPEAVVQNVIVPQILARVVSTVYVNRTCLYGIPRGVNNY